VEIFQEVPKPDTITQVKTEDFVDPIIQLHKDMKIVTVLKGKVIDETSAAPLAAVITLVDNTNQHIIAKINSNPQTGDFELVIPHGGNYGVATEKAGYLFNSINFNVPQFAEYQEIDTHILMVKAEVGSKIVLKNIFFDVGKTDLKGESIAELEKIKELLSTNSHLKVQINGHTDNTGNAATNMTLSLKRSEAVIQYLIEHGIDANRLQAKGFGSERPLVSNDDEQGGREINRRTEIEIIEAVGQG
jgi:outer membrane protein OmpA-like peptidoglycan-associated protein